MACCLVGTKPLSLQCWNIVYWILRNKLQLNSNQNTKLFIHENAFENVAWKWQSYFSRKRWVDTCTIVVNFYLPNPTWNRHHTEKFIPCSLFSINTFTAGVIWIDAHTSFIYFNHCQTEISIQIGHHTSMAIPYYKYNIPQDVIFMAILSLYFYHSLKIDMETIVIDDIIDVMQWFIDQISEDSTEASYPIYLFFCDHINHFLIV